VWVAAFAKKSTAGEKKVITCCLTVVFIIGGLVGVVASFFVTSPPDQPGFRWTLFWTSLGLLGIGILIPVILHLWDYYINRLG
jgi:uncharacterized membrane protein YczE